MIHRELGGADAFFTDRHGGTSVGPYTSANLASHVGDEPHAVVANRAAVARAIGRRDRPWVQPHHVHGTTVVALTDAGSIRAVGAGREADGTATARSDALLVAIGADCAPVAIANDTAWAAVHAGWRGAADGVVQAGVAAVRALGRGPVRVVVGPCIGAAHYEFGAEDLDRLARRLGPTVRARTDDGAPAFDLRVGDPPGVRAESASSRSRCSTCARSPRPTTSRTGGTARPAVTAWW